jgi:hypothetical protein
MSVNHIIIRREPGVIVKKQRQVCRLCDGSLPGKSSKVNALGSLHKKRRCAWKNKLKAWFPALVNRGRIPLLATSWLPRMSSQAKEERIELLRRLALARKEKVRLRAEIDAISAFSDDDNDRVHSKDTLWPPKKKKRKSKDLIFIDDFDAIDDDCPPRAEQISVVSSTRPPPATLKAQFNSLTSGINFDDDWGEFAHCTVPDAKNIRKELPKKKKKRPHPVVETRKKASTLWSEAYRPRTSAELVQGVNKANVEKIRSWILRSSRPHSLQQVLLLTGPTGVGKSTIVRVLANELNINLREWTDAESDGTMSYTQRECLSELVRGQKSIFGALPRYISQIDDLKRFLFRTKQLKPLEVVSTSTLRSQSHLPVSSVILLDSLPGPGKNRSYASLHLVFEEYLGRQLSNQTPLVIVYSGPSGCAPTPNELKKVFGAKFLASARTEHMKCLPIPPTSMKRVLLSIAKSEGFPDSFTHSSSRKKIGKSKHPAGNSTVDTLVTSPLEGIIQRSNGDIRHAITTMQYLSSGMGAPDRMHSSAPQPSKCEKDHNFEFLHGIGKLLYAKREPAISSAIGPLQYDPDRVAESTGLDTAVLAGFLSQNAPTHYSDISELCEMMCLLSDSDFIGKSENDYDPSHRSAYSNTSNASGMLHTSSYITARAISSTNKRPAPKSFKQIKRPQSLGVLENYRVNMGILRQAMQMPFSIASGRLCDRSVGIERFPYLSIINRGTTRIAGCTKLGTLLRELSCYGHNCNTIGTLDDKGKCIGSWTELQGVDCASEDATGLKWNDS